MHRIKYILIKYRKIKDKEIKSNLLNIEKRIKRMEFIKAKSKISLLLLAHLIMSRSIGLTFCP